MQHINKILQNMAYCNTMQQNVIFCNNMTHFVTFCNIQQHCRVCSAVIAYIAGYYVYTFQTLIKCQQCKSALAHSESDPCPNRSLILFKNYTKREGAGLKTPSGSLVKLLFVCEMVMRRNANYLHYPRIDEFLIVQVMEKISSMAILPKIAEAHYLQCGADYLELIRLICKKFFTLRMKKIAKDEYIHRSHGNSIDRLRIFSGL